MGFYNDGGFTFTNTNGTIGKPIKAGQIWSDDKLVQTSSIVVKENITIYENILDTIMNINVYEYNKINGDRQIGIITEDNNTLNELIVESFKPIYNNVGNIIGEQKITGIDIYGFISILLKGVQEYYYKTNNSEELTNNTLSEIYENQLNDNTNIQLSLMEMYEELQQVKLYNTQLELTLVDMYESNLLST